MKETTRNRALIVAALTCPCHLALLPLLATGTALGAMLEPHFDWFFAGAMLVFLGALVIAFWKPQEPAGASCENGRCGADERPRRSLLNPHTQEQEESWRAAAPR